MEAIANLIPRSLAAEDNLTPAEKLQLQCDAENAVKGEMYSLDCPLCNNKGVITYVDGDTLSTKECECMKQRRFISKIKTSGLESLSQRYKFRSFNAQKPYQKEMLTLAYEYAMSDTNEWMFMGGQCGSGKSHLCVAAAMKILKRGKAVRYFVWDDVYTDIALHTSIGTADEREEMVEALRNVEVLYIDDFLCQKQPKEAEVKLASEILKYRYNKNLRTIISSEKTLDELYQITRGLAGRISEKSGKFLYNIDHDIKKDYRLGGG
ncbi:MAG: ATP-binding protein [Clostridia bacterium]|nr:ATP-binding protein [Clostridia bacterium]